MTYTDFRCKQPNVNKNWPISVRRFHNKLQRNRAGRYWDFCCEVCCKTLQLGMTHVQLLLRNKQKSRNKSLVCHQPKRARVRARFNVRVIIRLSKKFANCACTIIKLHSTFCKLHGACTFYSAECQPLMNSWQKWLLVAHITYRAVFILKAFCGEFPPTYRKFSILWLLWILTVICYIQII